MSNKVALIGGAESTRDSAPYDDLSWEIWSVARRHPSDYLKRVTRLFEIHPRKSFEPLYLEELKQSKVPIYMQRKWDDIAYSIEFPIREFYDKDDWYVNTYSMLIPFAVHLGFKEITLYGIEVEYSWKYQWECFSYQARKAREKGTSVTFYGIEKEEIPAIYGYQYARWGDNIFVLPDNLKDVII
jgi:hypothetical protein